MPRATTTGAKKTGAKKVKYEEMISRAILHYKERNGSSVPAITKFIKDNYAVGDNLKVQLKLALQRGLEKERFVKVKASYKLAQGTRDEYRKKDKAPAAAAATKAKKPAAKKAKKPAAAKKAKKTATTTKSKKTAATKAKKPAAKKAKKPAATKAKKPAAAKKTKKPAAKKPAAKKPAAKKKTSGSKTRSKASA